MLIQGANRTFLMVHQWKPPVSQIFFCVAICNQSLCSIMPQEVPTDENSYCLQVAKYFNLSYPILLTVDYWLHSSCLFVFWHHTFARTCAWMYASVKANSYNLGTYHIDYLHHSARGLKKVANLGFYLKQK